MLETCKFFVRSSGPFAGTIYYNYDENNNQDENGNVECIEGDAHQIMANEIDFYRRNCNSTVDHGKLTRSLSIIDFLSQHYPPCDADEIVIVADNDVILDWLIDNPDEWCTSALVCKKVADRIVSVMDYNGLWHDIPVFRNETSGTFDDMIAVGIMTNATASRAKEARLIEFKENVGENYTIEDMENAGAHIARYRIERIYR